MRSERLRVTVPAADLGVTLADWLSRHGPLGASSALVIVLGVCADATALEPGVLGRSVGSISTANLRRDGRGRWRWQPVAAESRDLRPTDAEIVSRAGAVLMECLTGAPLADYLPNQAAVRARLRESRPDLPQAVVDLAARLASARSGARVTLNDVAAEISGATGVADARRSRWRRPLPAALAAVVVLLVGAAVALARRSEAEVLSHGLTRNEMTLSDLVTEAADYQTATGEFIVAFSHLDEIDRLWRARVPADDPRLELIRVRQAWARIERGDFRTAEQLLIATIAPLERSLGSAHPYTSAARRTLATILDRRGATTAASEQRELAAAAARPFRTLAADDGGGRSGVPPAPGVLAHVAPLAPEREGFRRRDDGTFFSPVTSIARSLAGTRGWRLHLAAATSCDTAVDVGRDPRRIAVAVVRAADHSSVRVRGVLPEIAIDLPAPAGPGHVLVRLDATPDGSVRVWTNGAAVQRAVIPPTGTAPPPYGLTFLSPQADDGCALVWWEVEPPA